MRVIACFAVHQNGAFGLDGHLPWPKCDQDMALFKEVTKENHLICGRSTFETLPNVVKTSLGRTVHPISGTGGLEALLDDLKNQDRVIIIGGAETLRRAFKAHLIDEAIVTIFTDGNPDFDVRLDYDDLWADDVWFSDDFPHDVMSNDGRKIGRQFVKCRIQE